MSGTPAGAGVPLGMGLFASSELAAGPPDCRLWMKSRWWWVHGVPKLPPGVLPGLMLDDGVAAVMFLGLDEHERTVADRTTGSRGRH
jgi:hypothetical protein